MDEEYENLANRHRFGVPIVPLTEQKASWQGWPWLLAILLWGAIVAIVAIWGRP